MVYVASVLVVRLFQACVLTVRQADPIGGGGGVQPVQFYLMGIKTSSYSKGFLLPLVHVSEVKLTRSEDTLRHFVINFSLHEVSQVLLNTRLQWETNYCQTTPMQKNSQTKAFTCA